MQALTTIDSVTGEILPMDTVPNFRTIEEAEDAFYNLLDQGESLRIKQVQILIKIRDQRLFKEKVDQETNKRYTSMEKYLKDICKSTAAFASDAPRTLKSWMTRWEVYHKQLGYAPEELQEMGAHFEILLPVASRNRTTTELTQQDEPQLSGGKKLGKSNFHHLVEEIIDKVRDSRNNPSADEVAWGVKDTRQRVNEILGNDTNVVKVSYEGIETSPTKIKITGITFWYDQIPYHLGDDIPIAIVKKIVGSSEVKGLNPNWRD